ncbi:hypothetical protein BDW22DRAFT_1358565 [Trametopsis cervina]|nr:hypothetical protein BDW22DRAFT_1358565 [Trametopsis cervina]
MSQHAEVKLGPLLVLICVACFLFGILTAQIFYYWNNYQKDGLKLKAFILFVWLLETLHTAFCIYVIYFWFVAQYPNIRDLETIGWSAVITVLLELIIVTLTEGHYIYRIWHLCHRKLYVVALPALLLALRFAFGLLTVTLLYKYNRWSIYFENSVAPAVLITEFSLGLASDFTITAFLIWYLRMQRTGFPNTNMRIQKLMHYTLNTGAITIIISAAIVGTINLPNSLFFFGLVEVVSKLYSNSMLAMLNARKHLQEAVYQESTGINIVTEVQTFRDPDIFDTKGSGRIHDRFKGPSRCDVNKARVDALANV